jgi:hypothetical protein
MLLKAPARPSPTPTTSVQLNGGTPTVTTYNAANQITNTGFSYDNAGNLIGDGTAAYTYDALSRTTARGGTTYAYNGDGTLVSQATGGVTTRYTQDLAAPLSQVLQIQVGGANPHRLHLRLGSPRITQRQHQDLVCGRRAGQRAPQRDGCWDAAGRDQLRSVGYTRDRHGANIRVYR